MLPTDFAVFILTHGRADAVLTYDTLRKHGYTGRIVVVIDNEDAQVNAYRAKFGSEVVVFDKRDVSNRMDEGDNFEDRRAIVYARNAAFEIAERLGVRYFVEMDDDYYNFLYRIYDETRQAMTLRGSWQIRNLDAVLSAMLKFYIASGATTIAMAQGGDFIGGRENGFALNPTLKRKAMNSFFCTNDRPFRFVGRVNEDVNSYTNLGARGALFFTVPFVSLEQGTTQKNAGGMTELYLDNGTYVKSFYTVMYAPSCTKVSLMGRNQKRLHHRIRWDCAVPVIVPEAVRKTK